MQTYAYGFPRLGANREFKHVIERFWKKECTQEEVFRVLNNIARENNQHYSDFLNEFPTGEMSLYDPMLDCAIMVGRYDPENLDGYYDLCRGGKALEMTKWFNTNYHYLVPDFSDIERPCFFDNTRHFSFSFYKNGMPRLIGPFTFLKLSKGLDRENFAEFFLSLVEVYRDILTGFEHVQLDEPAFVMDLDKEEIALIKQAYDILGYCDCKINLMTYYDSVSWLETLLDFKVSAIGLDFVHGTENLEIIKREGFSLSKKLIAGLIDGRNIWKNDIERSVEILYELAAVVGDLAVSNAAPLYHLPVSVDAEQKLPKELKKYLRFAEEKIMEIVVVASCCDGMTFPVMEQVCAYGQNLEVQDRVKKLREHDFVKSISFEQRRIIQQEKFNFGLFPMTTIGSFPQTKEVRGKRTAFNKGNLSAGEYDDFIRICMDNLLDIQHALDFDVFVHGEFERTDMVEFFAHKLEGIASTQSGWVISYGTRVYRPPIIFGDVWRKHPMTVSEILYAQSGTEKPVKGMLTGAVTLIAWSFVREDIPVQNVANQIALALRDEIRDYEKVGIDIVQVDEAAFREKAPIKRRDWKDYFKWAVRSFNLTTNTLPSTQIHTHMCYSEFGEIIHYINKMDFDVISIEAARSKGDIVEFFKNIDFDRQIGLGVWDIHSPAIPSVDEICKIVELWIQYLPKERLWLNPDCGLKTRGWAETLASLKNMALACGRLRRAHQCVLV